MSRTVTTLIGIISFVLLLTLFGTFFIVRQTEQAVVFFFGQHVATYREPGLKMKIPLVQNVEVFDKRLLDFNAEPKSFIAADQKSLVVDAFVRWRIVDPLRFRQTVGTETVMRNRLNTILESALRQAIASVPLSAIISSERTAIMHNVRDTVNREVSGQGETAESSPGGFGIEVVDVRITRADLPPANSESIYRRMQTEREREAKDHRAKGAEDATIIRANAERERTILLAEANRKAEILRGEGDGEATRIFAESFGRDPEFFQFWRTMQAYRRTLSGKDTTMVVSPEGDFLKYLEQGASGGR